MHATAHPCCKRAMRVLAVACLLLFAGESLAQDSPDEHAKHHPGAAGSGAMPAAPATTPAKGAMPGSSPAPGGMGGMGEMMKGMMGAPPPRELYPALMAMPVGSHGGTPLCWG